MRGSANFMIASTQNWPTTAEAICHVLASAGRRRHKSDMTTEPTAAPFCSLHPASNEKALTKLPSLACDAVIIDLEDAVAPATSFRA